MYRSISFMLLFGSVVLALSGCGGEPYFATPQKTLERYVDARMMSTREEYERCLNSFRKEDRQWFETHYMKLCTALYGQDCPGEGLATETAIWVDRFEPAGPRTANIESSDIDEDAGTATLTVDGKKIDFVKQRGNWKIKDFFGARQRLEEQFPQLK